jgi:ssDNA-binding Zn-finger/Zn-ribbon topoisomerase 1
MNPGAVITEENLSCHECGAPMHLKVGKYGLFYSCSRFPLCDGIHGAHESGKPLGIPADKPTREARIRAHAAFDKLWQGGAMKRGSAYGWLAQAMGLSRDNCHIGRFDREQYSKVVEVCEEYFNTKGK